METFKIKAIWFLISLVLGFAYGKIFFNMPLGILMGFTFGFVASYSGSKKKFFSIYVISTIFLIMVMLLMRYSLFMSLLMGLTITTIARLARRFAPT